MLFVTQRFQNIRVLEKLVSQIQPSDSSEFEKIFDLSPSAAEKARYQGANPRGYQGGAGRPCGEN